MASNPLDTIDDVVLDSGRFKYVLIRVHDKETGQSKDIVRGSARAAYHADVYEQEQRNLEAEGRLETECLGGGRIVHEPENRRIEVFGYSQGYGKADHNRTCQLLRQRFPDYSAINCSDDGY